MRLMPYVDGLVQGYIKDGLPSATVQTQLTNVFDRCPFVFVQVVPGGDEVHPELLDLVSVSIECYAKGSKRAVADLGEDVRVTLYTAVDQQIVRPEGHLSSYRHPQRFTEQRLPGQPADVYRAVGAFLLGIRPPA